MRKTVSKKFERTQPSHIKGIENQVALSDKAGSTSSVKAGIFLSILFLGIVIGVMFYWFQFRPTKIRAECNEIAYNYNPTREQAQQYVNEIFTLPEGQREERYNSLVKRGDIDKEIGSEMIRVSYGEPTKPLLSTSTNLPTAERIYKTKYESCLHEKGLK